MAGGRLGVTCGGVVLHEGRSEQLAGRRAGSRSARPPRRGRAGGRARARRHDRRPARSPAGAGRGRSSMPQSAAPRNMARQWCGLVSAPGTRSSSRADRGRRAPPEGHSCSCRRPRSRSWAPSFPARSDGRSWGTGRPWPAARGAARRPRRSPCAPVLDSMPGSSQRTGAPSTAERSERLGWPPSPGNPGRAAP